MTTTRLTRLALLAACSAALALAAMGCNIVGPVFLLIHGPEKTKAKFELDPERSHMLYIDDRANKLPRRALRRVVAQEAESSIITRADVPSENVITAAAGMQVASTERFGEPMSIVEIGRAVGAEVVIYAAVEDWRLSADGETVAPYARLRVKLIDASQNKRIWPDASINGYTLAVEMPPSLARMPENLAAMNQLQRDMAVVVGDRLAKLFYDHEKDTLSGQLGD
jgi:hypothetical protein